MARARRDAALHRAGLLEGELVRLGQRRERQIARARADYRSDLFAMVMASDASLLQLVVTSLLADGSAPELLADVRHAVSRRALPIDAEFPEVDEPTPESDDLPPPLPPHRIMSAPPREAPLLRVAGGAEGARVLTQAEHAGIGAGGGDEDWRDRGPDTPRLDGNEAWGLPVQAKVFAPDVQPRADVDLGLGFDERGRAYRYPEAGEPARQLPDGRIVADTVAADAVATEESELDH